VVLIRSAVLMHGASLDMARVCQLWVSAGVKALLRPWS
jgi:hypothetical protein